MAGNQRIDRRSGATSRTGSGNNLILGCRYRSCLIENVAGYRDVSMCRDGDLRAILYGSQARSGPFSAVMFPLAKTIVAAVLLIRFFVTEQMLVVDAPETIAVVPTVPAGQFHPAGGVASGSTVTVVVARPG